MAETNTEIDLDSVIDRLLEGELAIPMTPSSTFRSETEYDVGYVYALKGSSVG